MITKGGHSVEVLWCPNRNEDNPTGWKFPRAVERQLLADCEGQSVVHFFGGQSKFGTRLDIDPIVRPDVFGDAWLPPFSRESFDVVILDPPYIHFNSQQKTALFRAAGWVARKRVIWFHTVWMAPTGGLKYEKAWLVRVGDNCATRALQYFTVARRPGPPTYFERGPAMKYNRWLSQPQGFPFDQDGEGMTP